ncbi:hypothetical protein CspHIS471_0507350 [Cutaneotrichosporon sp. HIS471]|nr:hypothetical protein CspHIS471_0507350 [Cutaneotrichosporon sp. HIS471]
MRQLFAALLLAALPLDARPYRRQVPAGVAVGEVTVTNPDGSVATITLPFVPGDSGNSQTSALPPGVQETQVTVTNPDGSVATLTLPFVPSASQGSQGQNGQNQGGQNQPQPVPTSPLPAGVTTAVVPVTNPDGSVSSITIPFVPGAAQPSAAQSQGGENQGSQGGQNQPTPVATTPLAAGVSTTVVAVTNPDGSVSSLTLPYVPGTPKPGAQPSGDGQQGQQGQSQGGGQNQPTPAATTPLPAGVSTVVVPVTNPDGSVSSVTIPVVPGTAPSGSPGAGEQGQGQGQGQPGQSQAGQGGQSTPAGTVPAGVQTAVVPVTNPDGSVSSVTIPFVPGAGQSGAAGQGGAGAQPGQGGQQGTGTGTGTGTGANPFTSPVASGTAINGDYTGQQRPQVHYTPPIGFMGPPTGLLKDSKGTWHLYYEYNPSNTTAGNQHWGHATSPDGYKWENKPIAIWPPSAGAGALGGSVVTDPDNTSGLFANGTGNDNVVAIYTTAQGQALAYSADGGNTFTAHNGTVLQGGRDPKVIRNGNKWVMAVAVDRQVQIHTSDDLKTWTKASDISGDALGTGQLSSPNLVRVGDKWALLVSTNPGGTKYWTGDFNGTHFTPANAQPKAAEWGPDGSGGQVCYPDSNGQTVYMTWADNPAYADQTPTGGEYWRGTMSLPRLLTLANGTDGQVLTQEPLNPGPIVGPLISGHKSEKGKFNYTIDTNNLVKSGAMMVIVNVTNLTGVGPAHTVNWTFFSADKKQWLESGYRFDGTAWIRRGKVGSFNAPGYEQNLNTTSKHEGNSFTVASMVDRSILETFIDQGKSVATNLFFANATLNQVGVWADVPEGTSVEAYVFALNGVWGEAGGGGGGGAGMQAVSNAMSPEPTAATPAPPPAATPTA